MSRFIEALQAKMTGDKRAIFEPLSYDIKKLEASTTYPLIDEYEFRIEWKVRAACQKQDFDGMMKNVLHELRSAVYGDLRDRVIRLERAVYEQDRKRVLMETRDLLQVVTE